MRSTTHLPGPGDHPRPAPTLARKPLPKAVHTLKRALCIGLCGMGLLAVALPQAQASTAAPKKKLQRVDHIDPRQRLPGGETPYERERRLRRECKGRPNAGACSGYTH
ncbi:hypothetical protein [Hydrogenophaga soli]|nr:hypothetical protein [Burkholderiaceae bacterium]